jgi:transcriptional antiterminator RfaH
MAVIENKSALWFCVRSLPKHEHIAAAHLRKMDEMEVFLPRVRFKRATRQGSVWVTEALFPGYLFAHFDWLTSRREVQYASGVHSIVHFGKHFPAISENTIVELKKILGSTEFHTICQKFCPGDAVQITDGALCGLSAVVTHVMSSQDRIEVLMEFLGQQTMVELTTHSIIKESSERSNIFLGLGNLST